MPTELQANMQRDRYRYSWFCLALYKEDLQRLCCGQNGHFAECCALIGEYEYTTHEIIIYLYET